MKDQPDLVVLRVIHKALIAAQEELPEPSYNIGRVVTLIEEIIQDEAKPIGNNLMVDLLIYAGELDAGQRDWANSLYWRDPKEFWAYIGKKRRNK